MKKILLGGLASAVVVFLWGFISHMMLPIGDIGMKTIGNEEAVISTLKENINEEGVYIIPGFDYKKEHTKEDEKIWAEKYAKGPIGFLVYKPVGVNPMAGTNFFFEILVSFLGGLLASFIVLKSKPEKFWCRVGIVTFMGIFAWLTISIPYWNWYKFPLDFTLAQGIDEIFGWFLGGLAIAKIVKPEVE